MNYKPAGYEDDDAYKAYYLEDDFANNLKITLIPDTITIGACLNGENFDSRLTEELDIWFYNFREQWNAYKRSPTVLQDLKITLLKFQHPLEMALKLFANCPGCTNLKNKNVAVYLIESIHEFKKQRPSIAESTDDNTRMVAFNFVKTCGMPSIYKAVIETYELIKIRNLLVPKLRDLLAQGFLKEVAQWAIYLEITNEFGIIDIVFPLILIDKVYVAEEYLNVAKHLQIPTVKFLDGLLDKRRSVFENAYEILSEQKYPNVNHSILAYRPLSKLVARLAKNYNIDCDQMPNLNFTKTCKYLRHLYRRYQEGGMSCESWRELVPDSATTKSLQIDLLASLVSYNDKDEAAYWGNYFNIQKEECSAAVYERMLELRRSNVAYNTAEETACDISRVNAGGISAATNKDFEIEQQEYLRLQLPDDCIILVAEPYKLEEMLAYLSRQSCIAFDSEWKPSVSNDSTVSLLQMATIERVYLLDCESREFTTEHWKQLGQRVFNNMEILKIGFSLEHDLQMLQKSLPIHLNLSAAAGGYLDLRKLWLRLKYMQIIKLPSCTENLKGESLAALAEICLGKKLDKSNQCSNWSNRPLRRDQILYAALDAHCLLEIYEFLRKALQQMGIDLEQVVEEMTTAKTGYLLRMRNGGSHDDFNSAPQQSINNERPLNFVEKSSCTVFSIRFICDTMLAHLSKELRKLGLDCIDIRPKYKVDYADLAKRERRIVLTRDERYADFTKYLPKSQCLQIPLDSFVNQIHIIIQLFGLKIHELNLFTRCIHCNSNVFILANRDAMHLMRYGYEECGKSMDPHTEIMNLQYLQKKTFHLLQIDERVISTKTTFAGAAIKIHRVKPNMLRFSNYFYICDSCGSCSWDGAYSIHHSIMNIVDKSAGSQTLVTTVPSTQF